MGMITFSETITLLTLIFFCLRYISFKDNDSDDLNNDNNHLEDFLLLFVPRPHYNNDNDNDNMTNDNNHLADFQLLLVPRHAGDGASRKQ